MSRPAEHALSRLSLFSGHHEADAGVGRSRGVNGSRRFPESRSECDLFALQPVKPSVTGYQSIKAYSTEIGTPGNALAVRNTIMDLT